MHPGKGGRGKGGGRGGNAVAAFQAAIFEATRGKKDDQCPHYGAGKCRFAAWGKACGFAHPANAETDVALIKCQLGKLCRGPEKCNYMHDEGPMDTNKVSPASIFLTSIYHSLQCPPG